MVIWYLKQIGKVQKLSEWVPYELTANQKNCHFEVSSSLILCNSNEPFLDQIVMYDEKMDFIWQSAITNSVVGLRSYKALPKAKLHPKKSHCHCFVVCCPSDLLQLSESQWNHYIWEVCSANWWDAWKLHACSWHCSTERAQCCTTTLDCMSQNQRFKSWTNWATKFCLICCIHTNSCQLTTTSSRILTTFCRENASTTRIPKMISKGL